MKTLHKCVTVLLCGKPRVVCVQNCHMISIQSFTTSIDSKIISELARLRIQVFRDYPYLYDGSMDYEMQYLQTHLNAPQSIVVVAFDGDQVVGASTALPMAAETENIKEPWLAKGFDVDKIFYFGESVLLNTYRSQGIGVAFFEHREKWARQCGQFDILTFCGVVRPDKHPLKPDNYVPLDNFWTKRGFVKTPDIVCRIAWKDIDQEHETEKPLHFWMKYLNGLQ